MTENGLVRSTFEESVWTRPADDLGCEIIRDRRLKTLTIRQGAYARKILAAHGMTAANPVKTPLPPGVRLSEKDCPATPDPTLHCQYRAIIGHLSFLVQMSRPDLAFTFAELSKFVQCPGDVHMKAARHMLAYLAGTLDEGVTYQSPSEPGEKHCLGGWVDSYFASDPDNRRSTSGYLRNLLCDLGFEQTRQTEIFEDNASRFRRHPS
mmetsp:Transcript_5130/g.10308  ORF Transcript_5130/g.10308 Transcript_5130/m.10308 type:complete len:208 (+) Transcript_5130:335-958(+)